MCGIIAGIAQKDSLIKDNLMKGLERLEYRGYDSAGIGMLSHCHQITIIKSSGKLSKLKAKIKKQALSNKNNLDSNIGIAHTRWATHGEANTLNAHPHQLNDYCIVHNGIIDNYQEIKKRVSAHQLQSQTDSEAIAGLINKLDGSTLTRLSKLYSNLKGSFSLVILDSKDTNHIYATKEKSPLIIGLAKNANYIASDIAAFSDWVDEFIYLEDGDIARVSNSQIEIFNSSLKRVKRNHYPNQTNALNLVKGKYKYFMEKEIFEQPIAIRQTIKGKLREDSVVDDIFGTQSRNVLEKIENIHLVGCGTSLNAGLLAKYWLEDLTSIPAQAESASEYLYRKVVLSKNTLVVAISQSGETADIISVVKKIKANSPNTSILAICNTQNSELVRLSDLTFITQAGIETSVASTKAFSTQLIALMLLCLAIMQIKKINQEQIPVLIQALKKIPKKIEQVLESAAEIEKLANKLITKKSALFVARGMQYPIAIEGALKLKEISYIHAEAYAAGELKHGPLALIDGDMPVIAIIDENNLFEKIKSSLEIISARGGNLFIFTNEQPIDEFKKSNNKNIIYIKNNLNSYLSPLVFNVCLQLLAYHVAFKKGLDIDQPRNLAKSVTVE